MCTWPGPAPKTERTAQRCPSYAGLVLTVSSNVLRQIQELAYLAFPAECCGVLLGISRGEERTVTRIVACANVASDPRRKYEIAPADLVRCQREARACGEEIVGFYHSHPDHPAQPSPTDSLQAYWTGCSYVILSVTASGVVESRSFLLLAGGFREEALMPT